MILRRNVDKSGENFALRATCRVMPRDSDGLAMCAVIGKVGVFANDETTPTIYTVNVSRVVLHYSRRLLVSGRAVALIYRQIPTVECLMLLLSIKPSIWKGFP